MKNNQEICNIILLPSKRDYIGHYENVVCKDKYGYYLPVSDESRREAIKKGEVYELYVVSNQDIKEGDTVIEIEKSRICKVLKSEINENQEWDLFLKVIDNNLEYYPINIPRKIVCTTDSNLKDVFRLPDSVIKDFVKYAGPNVIRLQYLENELIFDWIY